MLTPAFSILGCAFFCEEGNWLPHISMPWLEICVGPTPQCRHLPWDYLPHTQNLSAMCAAGVHTMWSFLVLVSVYIIPRFILSLSTGGDCSTYPCVIEVTGINSTREAKILSLQRSLCHDLAGLPKPEIIQNIVLLIWSDGTSGVQFHLENQALLALGCYSEKTYCVVTLLGSSSQKGAWILPMMNTGWLDS